MKISLVHCAPAGVLHGQALHAAAVQGVRELFNLVHGGRVGGERADPGLAAGVMVDHARLGDVPGREDGALDHPRRVFRHDLLVADAVLYRADRAVAKDRRDGLHGRPGKHGLGGDNAELALRNLAHLRPRMHGCDKITQPGQAQTVFINSVHMLARQVKRPDLDVIQPGQVRAVKPANGAATDDAYLHLNLLSISRIVLLSADYADYRRLKTSLLYWSCFAPKLINKPRFNPEAFK